MNPNQLFVKTKSKKINDRKESAHYTHQKYVDYWSYEIKALTSKIVYKMSFYNI